jgi:hypothetical protein
MRKPEMRTLTLAAVAAVVATSAFAGAYPGPNDMVKYPNMEHLSKATQAKPAPAVKHLVVVHRPVHRG